MSAILDRVRNWRTFRSLLMLALGLIVGVLVGWRRGIPFAGSVQCWSIGIYAGPSPFALSPAGGVANPVLTTRDVTDVPAEWVADPFMVHDGARWYMFFEVLNGSTGHGDIGLATSPDGFHWRYEHIVLDEPFHLSYPYVFQRDGAWYMIPESYEASVVRLYRAQRFPDRWEPLADLIEGPYADSSVVEHDGRWWMFTSLGCEALFLFSAEALPGPWVEHPASPLIVGNGDIARPGGRVLSFGGRLYRMAQDDTPRYGNRVQAFEITALTVDAYAEQPVEGNPVLDKTGSGWNGLGMHHVDPHPLADGSWIACVDGYGEMHVFGLAH